MALRRSILLAVGFTVVMTGCVAPAQPTPSAPHPTIAPGSPSTPPVTPSSSAGASVVPSSSGQAAGGDVFPIVGRDGTPPPGDTRPTATDLILADQESGAITSYEALLDRIYAMFGDARLPE